MTRYTQVAAFKTADGKIFETEAEAQAHEIQQQLAPQLNAFMELYVGSFPSGEKTQRMARQAIMAWEQFKAGGAVAVPGQTEVAGTALSQRTKNILLAAGIKYMEEAQAMGPRLLTVPNLGRASMAEIIAWDRN